MSDGLAFSDPLNRFELNPIDSGPESKATSKIIEAAKASDST
jgi:hypothetical protein